MPTVLDIEEPAVQVQKIKSPMPQPLSDASRPSNNGPVTERVLFSHSLLESSSRERARRGTATTMSFILQCFVVAGLLIVPLMFTEALPTAQLVTMLVAPPPPPPPPPPAAEIPVVKVVQTNLLDNGRLRTPSRIPRKVEMIKEEEAPPPAFAGVVGGVPGGVPGGQLGGVIGSIVGSATSSSSLIPKLDPPKRVRISQGITKGMVITKVEPAYPRLALGAHVSGVVVLKAVIGKDGLIHELQLVSGHPLLISAAMDAVRQWRYRPYLLSGEPVEVETTINVTFQIEG